MNRVSCGARLDRLPDSKWHWKTWFTISFALLVCWSNAIGGLVLAQLKEIGWSDHSKAGIFSSLTTAGMFAGALLGGIIGDKIGRKKSILFFEAIHIIAMLAGACSPSMEFLIGVRFIQGFGLGALLTVLFAGFTEYTPGRNRGSWSSRASFIGNWSYPVCSTIALFLTPIIRPELNWRIQFVIPSILSLVACVIIYRNLEESPRWLESRGRYTEADEIMSRIEAYVEKTTGKPLPEPKAGAEMSVKNMSYTELLKGSLLKRVILGSCVLIAMNVVQYTLINWLPSIFLTQGINLKDSIVLNTMSMFGAPFGIFIGVLVMDKIPRKIMGTGLLVLIAGLGYIYSLQTNMTMITILGFFLITFVYMYVCYASAVYVPEIWPTAAKLRGSGLANAVGRVSGIVAPIAVAKILQESGVSGVFILLGGVSLLVAVVIAFMGVETKGVSIESIGSVSEKKAGK